MNEAFKEELFAAMDKFDGHVTNGSFQEALKVILKYNEVPRCPKCLSYKLSCQNGHTWEIPG